MKKIYKTLLPLGAIASITIVPISALSCAQTEKQLFEAEIKSVQDIIKSTSNGFTASTKVKLSKAVLTAQQALAAAQNDEEIKKAKEYNEPQKLDQVIWKNFWGFYEIKVRR
ncbi:Uncharacterised protein [Chlamydia trachomatis]|nr:Uncharacterised protein [Chlamydia trachomatis]